MRAPPPGGPYLAFNAPKRKGVDVFFAAGICHGGVQTTCDTRRLWGKASKGGFPVWGQMGFRWEPVFEERGDEGKEGGMMSAACSPTLQDDIHSVLRGGEACYARGGLSATVVL